MDGTIERSTRAVFDTPPDAEILEDDDVTEDESDLPTRLPAVLNGPQQEFARWNLILTKEGLSVRRAENRRTELLGGPAAWGSTIIDEDGEEIDHDPSIFVKPDFRADANALDLVAPEVAALIRETIYEAGSVAHCPVWFPNEYWKPKRRVVCHEWTPSGSNYGSRKEQSQFRDDIKKITSQTTLPRFDFARPSGMASCGAGTLVDLGSGEVVGHTPAHLLKDAEIAFRQRSDKNCRSNGGFSGTISPQEGRGTLPESDLFSPSLIDTLWQMPAAYQWLEPQEAWLIDCAAAMPEPRVKGRFTDLIVKRTGVKPWQARIVKGRLKLRILRLLEELQ